MDIRLKMSRNGERVYILGNTYFYRNSLRSIGAKFDKTHMKWWIDSVRVSELEEVLSRPPIEDKHTLPVMAKCLYQGMTLYAVSFNEGRTECRLLSLDTSIDITVPVGEAENCCQILREYRKIRSGFAYGARFEYHTIERMKRFVENHKGNRGRKGRCSECDSYGTFRHDCQECGLGVCI